MHIQTIRRSGHFENVNTDTLERKTGFDGPIDMAELFAHVVNCYSHEDWRLVDAQGAIVTEYEGI